MNELKKVWFIIPLYCICTYCPRKSAPLQWNNGNDLFLLPFYSSFVPKYDIHFLQNVSVRVRCSTGLGVGLVMTISPWSWFNHRFASSFFSAEAASVNSRSIIRDSTASQPETVASTSTKLEIGSAARKEVILVRDVHLCNLVHLSTLGIAVIIITVYPV